VTYDNSELAHYQVIADFPVPDLALVLGAEDYISFFSSPGLFRFISGDEQNIGAQIKGDFNYIDSKVHKGSIAFGAEFTHFSLDDVRYTLGNNYTIITQENPLIAKEGTGRENSYNGYIQLKHQWRSVIFNAGLRYDHKKRVDDMTLNEFSPRVAFILLQPKWNLKLSYSRSFVDAPYLYRKTNELLDVLVNEDSYQISADKLNPEFVNSLQVTFSGLEWLRGLNFEINAFYNKASNLIQTHVITQENQGTNKTGGIEFMANYHNRKFTVDFNLTWTHTFKSNILERDVDDNNNTPAIMSNAVVAWQVTPRLKLHTHILFEGRQDMYNTGLVELLNLYTFLMSSKMVELPDEEYRRQLNELSEKVLMHKSIPSRAIFNIGADYQLGKFTLSLNVRNLFNTYYYRSGMNTNVVPQKGRWFMFEVAYKF
jgi:iron complex outermembrane receptor protein